MRLIVGSCGLVNQWRLDKGRSKPTQGAEVHMKEKDRERKGRWTETHKNGCPMGTGSSEPRDLDSSWSLERPKKATWNSRSMQKV